MPCEAAVCVRDSVGQCTLDASHSQMTMDLAGLYVELFIEEVQKYHKIWDITQCDYHNRIKKRAAWYAIFVKFDNGFAGKPDGEKGEIGLKFMKWKGIKDTFTKSETMATKSGQGASSARRYIYARQLSFLLKTVQPGTGTTVQELPGFPAGGVTAVPSGHDSRPLVLCWLAAGTYDQACHLATTILLLPSLFLYIAPPVLQPAVEASQLSLISAYRKVSAAPPLKAPARARLENANYSPRALELSDRSVTQTTQKLFSIFAECSKHFPAVKRRNKL
ncbi:hypothetical protein PR048_031374 [Dryococelus australis]|uniref:MADF domain-containing protein n=1 Tax=Dryococelus australis TaxID=614101 RepID=A0ABQ9G671_9NEOP|nr:hypothetical protein PR048_031374 [Dryococelus australis]